MRNFLRVLFGLAIIAVFFIGMILVKDLGTLTETHKWFEGTKLEERAVLFILTYVITFSFIITTSLYFLISNVFWVRKKKWEEAITKADKEYKLYQEAKDNLAIEAFGYKQRAKALHKKITK